MAADRAARRRRHRRRLARSTDRSRRAGYERRRRVDRASLTTRELAAEIAESTERMSKLVKAIKAYAFMDRGELVETDVHEGLETTLVVLGHKLKHTSIEVRRDYDRSLPKLTLRGSELNQVWTNLLANAIEALGETGMIKIVTQRDGVCARVDIADNGPGIPENIRDHVFDPFFTTKDVGEGTGLGLDTARRIVTERLAARSTSSQHPGEPCSTSGFRSTGRRSRPANRRNARRRQRARAAAGLRNCKPAHRKGSLELAGLEPATSSVRSRRSLASHPPHSRDLRADMSLIL